jgi:hypothetical protein
MVHSDNLPWLEPGRDGSAARSGRHLCLASTLQRKPPAVADAVRQ